MRVGLGVDIVELDRIAGALDRHGERFLRRCFTAGELAYCGRRIGALAARFAAKEAVAKALGTGIAGFRWRDVEILRDDAGKPLVRLHGGARERLALIGATHCEVTLSHSRDYAVAAAIAYGSGSDHG